MIAIQIGQKVVHIPSNFKELEQDQYFKWCELMHSELTQVQFNLLMLLNLLKWHKSILLKSIIWKEYFFKVLDKITFGVFTYTIQTFDMEELTTVAELSELFSTNIQIPLDNYLPSFRIGLKSYIGPEKHFTNITFRQFRKAEEYFALYQKTKKEEYLNMLISWLYTPSLLHNTPFFKKSLTFSNTSKRSKTINKLAEAKKISILYFYAANRSELTKIYKELYDRSADDSEKEKFSVARMRAGFEKSLRLMSGNVNNDEQTDFQAALDVLAHMNDKAAQALELKKMYEK